MDGVDVGDDVARLVGEEEHVELLHRMENVTHRVGLEERVLTRIRNRTCNGTTSIVCDGV